MYGVKLKNGKWWISKDGEIVESLGSFDDPVTPEIIAEEINDVQMNRKYAGACYKNGVESKRQSQLKG